jgi:hypothetical protein
MPISHHLLHPANILRLFGLLLYLLLFISGPGPRSIPASRLLILPLDLIIYLIIEVDGGIYFLILGCHSKMNIL